MSVKEQEAKVTQALAKIKNRLLVFSGGLSGQQTTCCGREERCDTPPCSDGGTCRRD